MFTPQTGHYLGFGPPSFPAGYRGFASQLRRKNAPNVSKKFEDVLKKSELSPAGSNLGAPELNRQAPVLDVKGFYDI
jgi:hypothetical protein